MHLIDTVRIRNERNVYADGSSFVVAHIDSKGNEHHSRIPSAAVDKIYDLCTGQTITMEEAGARIEPFARKMGLPYHYGWRLNFYTLEILVVLVAIGKADLWKEGRGFKFQVT